MTHVRRTVLLCLAIVACDGGDESEAPATCGVFAACGGVVEGTWTAEKTCAPPSMTVPTGVCGDATVDFSMAQAMGEVTFAKDGTYKGGIGLAGTARLMLPAACLNFNGQKLTCQQLSLAIGLAQVQNKDLAALGAIACTGMDTCTCVATLPMAAMQSNMGTYTVANNTLTLTQQGQPAQSLPYCVKGSRLEAALSVPTPGGAAMAQGYVILHRK